MSAPVPGPLNLHRRPSRTVPALIASVLLLALGVLLCWLAVYRLVEGRWPESLLSGADAAGRTAWNDPAAWITGGVLAGLGLVLLLCGLIPGGYRTLPLRTPAPAGTGDTRPADGSGAGTPDDGGSRGQERDGTRPGAGYAGGSGAVVSRRGVARLAAATCEHIDGVSSASATAGDRVVHVRVDTALRDTADLQTWVIEGVRSRLEASGLDPVPEVRVEVRSTG